jgi:adenosylhomocysteine nucleosidase
MPEEIAALLDVLEERRDESLGALDFHRGRIEGQHVILARCGIGKVNAAATAQTLALLAPRALIFTGVAGAADRALAVGDVVVGTDAVQHDVDVTALGYEAGVVPGEPLSWSSAPALVELALAAAASIVDARVVTGRIASGDQFLADVARTGAVVEAFGAVCVEMEGAAVAQVCARAGLPFVIIRSISDGADFEAQVSFREFTVLAAGRAKRLVRSMLAMLGNAGGPAANTARDRERL